MWCTRDREADTCPSPIEARGALLHAPLSGTLLLYLGGLDMAKVSLESPGVTSLLSLSESVPPGFSLIFRNFPLFFC